MKKFLKKVSKFLRRATRSARKNLGRATRNARKIFRGGNPNAPPANATPAPVPPANATPAPAPVPAPVPVPVPVPVAAPRKRRRKAKKGAFGRVRNTVRKIGKKFRNVINRVFSRKSKDKR
jgi:hypothetical protein